MLMLTPAQIKRALTLLISFHILIISASNYLVQLPFQIFGFHTTWGAFSFPFVYLATDLTVRIFGKIPARRIIFMAMVPALVVSYVIGVIFHDGAFQGMTALAEPNSVVFRIAFASFAAYCFGQLMDIRVFSTIRERCAWWVAPTASTVIGNLIDTILFFGIAFYQSDNPFMAANWPEIASVDYGFKLLISLCLFLPAYGVLLKVLQEMILSSGTKAALR